MFAVRHQKNIKYLMVITVVVVAVSPFLRLSPVEYMILSISISLVVMAELFNSGIEYAIDLVTDDYHELAKAAKDVAAAAVVFACGNALVVATMFVWSRIGSA